MVGIRSGIWDTGLACGIGNEVWDWDWGWDAGSGVYGYWTDLAKIWERYGVELGRDMDMGWDWDDHRMG